MSKKFGESYQKTNKTKGTNKFSLLPFKIVAIRYNRRLTTFVQLPETISKSLLWNRSFSNVSVTSPTSQLILQTLRRFTYVTAHSPILLLLLRHRLFTYVIWRVVHAYIHQNVANSACKYRKLICGCNVVEKRRRENNCFEVSN